MEILRLKLIWVGILNLGFIKKKEKRSDGNLKKNIFGGVVPRV